MVVFEWFILALVLASGLSIVFYQLYTGVPPMPSKQSEREQAIELLQAADLNDGVIYELGCGWGGLILMLTKAFPDRPIVGYELSWLPFLVARFRCRKLKNVKIYRNNFFKKDFPQASAVLCYLMMGSMPKLAAHLDKQLATNTPVITLAFWFHDRKPAKKISVQGPGVALYYWPAK